MPDETIVTLADGSTVRYRNVAGFPGYRVGSDGSVWSCRRNGGSPLRGVIRFSARWHRLKPVEVSRPLPNDTRYLAVRLNYRLFRVHRLVLEAFVGPCPTGMEACHNDGNASNNNLINLRWDDRVGNYADSVKHGTRRPEKLSPLAAKYLESIRLLRDKGLGNRRIAKKLNISRHLAMWIVRKHLKTQ